MDRLASASAESTFRGAKRRGGLARLLAAGLLAANLAGCQIVIGVLQMLQGPPKITAPFTQQSGARLDGSGKRVVVLCRAESNALAEHPSLCADMTMEVAGRLKDHNIQVADPASVVQWLDDADQITEKSDMAKIAARFEADYVVLLSFEEFGFRERHSAGLYRGRARVKVLAWSVKGAGEDRAATRVYRATHESAYPPHTPISSDQQKLDVFSHRYVAHLADELARHFYDHRPGEDI